MVLFSVRQTCLPVLTRTSSKVISKSSNETQYFPIHRIYCIGRNYRDHAIEMGHCPDREAPFFFHKPADAVTTTSEVSFPSMTSDLHYEAELIVALRVPDDDRVDNIKTLDEARKLIYGYGIGCDLTRRDLQAEAKKLSRPWCSAKGFDHSAPMTPITPKEEIIPLQSLSSSSPKNIDDGIDTFQTIADHGIIELHVNGELKQRSPLSFMIWSIPEMIMYLSKYYTLQSGDIIMTGTPAGVGKLTRGDEIQISVYYDNSKKDEKKDILPKCQFVMV